MDIDYSDWVKQQEDDSVGSAGSQQNSIDISNKIVSAFESKLEAYTKENPEKSLTLDQLKSVYRNGARVICEECHPNKSNHQWGLARVNMFIYGDKPINKTQTEVELKGVELEDASYISFADLDISLDWIPSEDMFEIADRDVEKYDLDINFDSVDDLYLDGPVSDTYFDLD